MSESAPTLKRKNPLAKLFLAVTASTSLASAEPAQASFNRDQFARGLLSGLAQGAQRAEDQRNCLRVEIPSAEENIRIAEDEARFGAERTNLEAESQLEYLRGRTDLTPQARAIEERRIILNRNQTLARLESNRRTAYRIANERVNSCRR